MIEDTKWIKGYEGKYQVTREGAFISYANNPEGRELLGSKRTNGRTFCLESDEDEPSIYRSLGRLVLTAFRPHPQDGRYYDVKFSNGNREDANLENLIWVPRTANIPTAKLSEAQRLKIVTRYDQGQGDVSQQELADDYGVSQNAISYIIRTRS
jgi:hypothetical protein